MSGRIPAALQAVFMASNQGEEVHVPPPEADRVYTQSTGLHHRLGAAAARIPLALQAIFLAAQSGKTVDVPPADRSASKTFIRRWRWQGQTDFSFAGCLPESYRNISPQQFLHTKLEKRGYLTRHRTYATKRTAYFNLPTAHQKASYGSRMITAIKQGQVKDLRHMLEAGLSPNACNAHGESLLHMVCRRGNWELFQVLTDSRFHVDLQVADDYGRTPLHDACWSSYPNFSLVRHLLRTDATFLFLEDARGSLPLAYVPKPHWALWNGFLEQVLDEVFPLSQSMDESVPLLCRGAPNSRPVRDPTNHVLPASLANMVANGIMASQEVLLAMTAASGDEQEEYLANSDNDEDDYSESDDDDSIGDDYGSPSVGLALVPESDDMAESDDAETDMGESADEVSGESEYNVSGESENEVSGESEYEGEYTTGENGVDMNDNQDEEDDDDDSSSSAFYDTTESMALVQTAMVEGN